MKPRRVNRLCRLLMTSALACGLLSSQLLADTSPSPEVLAKVSRLSHVLEKMRGETFLKPVDVELQSTEAFRAYVEKTLEQAYPKARARAQSAAMEAFGLLPKGYDLRKGLRDLFVSQAGAYYSPEDKKFYILMNNLPDDQMDALILHELEHALQDQRHGLARLRADALANPNEDTRGALGFLMEGEATYLMLKYQLRQAGQDLDLLPPEGRDFVLKTTAGMGRRTIIMTSRAGAPRGKEGDEIRAAMKALKDVPDLLFWGLYDPYFKGMYAIHKTFERGGWPAVDALFTHPPESTEMMLHPEKLADPRDLPQTLALPDVGRILGEDWRLVYSNTLGEHGVRILLNAQSKAKGRTASEGWDGDLYALYEGPNKSTLLLWWSVWDSDHDAQAFFSALDGMRKGPIGRKQPEGSHRFLDQSGAFVTMMVGPPEIVQKVSALRALPRSEAR